MGPLLKELFGIYWGGFDGYRPLLFAWRAGRGGGCPLQEGSLSTSAGGIGLSRFSRYWA